MKKQSIFFDDWKACLHAHYEHVVHNGDTITEPTLRQVLQQTGIPEDELITIQAAAGLLPDAVRPDEPVPGEEPALDDASVEVIEDALEDDEIGLPEDETGEVDPDDVPEELPDEILDDPPDDSPPPPEQLSLF